MAHVCPFGARDVTTTVAAGVSQVAARALSKTWKLAMNMEMSANVNSIASMFHDKREESKEVRDCYL